VDERIVHPKGIPREDSKPYFGTKDVKDVEKVLALCLDNHAYDELFWAFYTIITPIQRMDVDVTKEWIERHPPLVYCLLKTQPPTEDASCLLTWSISS
jgi:hypothetical protein